MEYDDAFGFEHLSNVLKENKNFIQGKIFPWDYFYMET